MLNWIDAICIDQSSIAEKSMQVPLMSDIYTRAHTVFVWLGDATVGSTLIYSYTWLLWCCAVAPGEALKKYLEQRVMTLLAGKRLAFRPAA